MKRLISSSIISLALAAGLWLVVGVWGWWLLGLVAVAAVEAPWRTRGQGRWPWLLIVSGLAVVIALATYPVGPVGLAIIAVGYAVMRAWIDAWNEPVYQAWAVQILAFWALFSWMAVGGLSRTFGALLVWLAAYATTRQAVRPTAGQLVGIISATWALVAAEIGWVLSAWLVTYVIFGTSVLIPQPALVLAGLGYCFGNIYLAQRRGQLNRWRFMEFIVVGLILIAIVIIGTNWRATV